MAAAIARVGLKRRPPATAELAITKQRRTASLSDTSPFRRPRGGTHSDTFGPYVVFEQLGEGGMARVHRAELVGSDGFRKPVALKRMNTHVSEDPDFITSFVHEAQLASRLQHPNIAQAYDLGKLAGTYFIAMELVLGPTLGQVMTQSRYCAGAVPLPIALEILIQLCDALDHAHDLRDEGGTPLQLIHRDVSPTNVIVSNEGIVKLIDFGIAKARSSQRTTQVGMIKGKHAYVAPEYTYGQLDRRVDLWGLGVIAHELLTGRRLFLGQTDAETIRNVRQLAVPPPSRHAPGISPELDDIVLTALQRDPELRWQNAGAMRVALTAEARRLGASPSGAQVKKWVEWAFEQSPRRETSVGKLLEHLEPSISIKSGDLELFEPSPVASRVASGSVDVRFSTGSLVEECREELCATIEVPAPRTRVPTKRERGEVVREAVRRAAWRPPTRWAAQPPRASSVSWVVLLGVLAFAAIAVHLGWIDVASWRALLG